MSKQELAIQILLLLEDIEITGLDNVLDEIKKLCQQEKTS